MMRCCRFESPLKLDFILYNRKGHWLQMRGHMHLIKAKGVTGVSFVKKYGLHLVLLEYAMHQRCHMLLWR